jgi:anthranilate/para-aminobenzoate synthase component II
VSSTDLLRVVVSQRVFCDSASGERRDARCASLLDFWRVDTILLTFGNTPCAPERDRSERELVRHARAKRIPFLGVCRGAQKIDLHFGGRLRPVRDARVQVGATHRVTLAPWTGSARADPRRSARPRAA